MGSGVWTACSFNDYTVKTKGSYRAFSAMDHRQIYKASELDPILDPKNVIRECCDTDEHPKTIPVILTLDVTGSMGPAAAEVAKKLNVIMQDLYSKVNDVEFLISAVGDMSYDSTPFQAGQFESDIRIAEQTDKIYFEGGGGGNNWESYTAAWYFGLYHTKLDCWDRGEKGIIITLGDEPLNPFLPLDKVSKVFGDDVFNKQSSDINTKDLFEAASKKFNIYHISVDDKYTCYYLYKDNVDKSWSKQLGGNYKVASLDNLANVIAEIITSSPHNSKKNNMVNFDSDGISW